MSADRTPRSGASPGRSLTTQLVFDASQPIGWGLLAAVVIALSAAAGAAYATGVSERLLLVLSPTLVTLLIGLATSGSLRAAAIGGLAFTFLQYASVAASGSPLLAAALMALVSAVGSLLAAPPRPNGLGDIVSLLYLLVAVFAPIGGQTRGLQGPDGVILALVGVSAGVTLLVVLKVLYALISRRSSGGADVSSTPAAETPDGHGMLSLSWTRRAIVYAIVRALIMGGLMYWFVLGGPGRDIGWIMLTVTAVMKPGSAGTISFGLVRSAGTLLGALLFGVLAAVTGPTTLTTIAIVATGVGLAYSSRSYLVMVVGITGAVVVMAGLPNQDFLLWAFARTVDTVLGAGIAVAAIALVGLVGGSEEESAAA